MGDRRLSVLALDRAVYDDGLPVRDLRSLPVRRRLPQSQPVDARSSHVHCTGAGVHTAARRARGAGRTYTRQPLALPFSSVNPSTLGRRRGSRQVSFSLLSLSTPYQASYPPTTRAGSDPSRPLQVTREWMVNK
jgi:hypothetical protein